MQTVRKITCWSFVWILFLSTISSSYQAKNVWSWRCKGGKCIKALSTEPNGSSTNAKYSQNVCKLICAPDSLMWPKPTGIVKMSSNLSNINVGNMKFTPNLTNGELPVETQELLQKLSSVFFRNVLSNLDNKNSGICQGHQLNVILSITNPTVTTFFQEVDESYELDVSSNETSVVAQIKAPTYIGARHATETLSQLIVFDEFSESLVIPSKVSLTDKPAFSYRGLLLDTSRNLYSVAAIKRTLDGMAASKLNTFHWHITDSQSFPMEIRSHPELSKFGAYNPKYVFTQADIRDIVDYAKVRGIRVLPELDTPGHVGEGWANLLSKEKAENLIVCFMAEPWRDYCYEPPCGQLNPTSDQVYDVLADIYSEMAEMFDSDLFHMGGDEVNMNCWNSSKAITEWMDKNNISRSEDGFHYLWSIFQNRASQKLQAKNKNNKKIVLWTSSLTTEERLQKYLDSSKYIVQIWTNQSDPLIKTLIDNGYSVIFSNYDALYLNEGFGPWIGEGSNWSEPFHGWKRIYKNDPIQLLTDVGVDASNMSKARQLILGQEIAMWSEQVDERNLDSRVWPRAAAMAERTWSNPDEGYLSAEYRMLHHRDRLVSRGINADPIQPHWCVQNEGACT